jgi:hypothetical protein
MDLEQLFKPRLPEADVEIEGVGTVRVRGLSRVEALQVRDLSDRVVAERTILALAMVDPPLTEAQVGRWQEASAAAEMERVVDKVTELSGLGSTSAKEAVQGFEANPDTEFRALSSTETVDDGGAASGGDG